MGIKIVDIRYGMVDPERTEDYIQDKTIGKQYDPGRWYRFNCRIRLKKRSIWIYW